MTFYVIPIGLGVFWALWRYGKRLRGLTQPDLCERMRAVAAIRNEDIRHG